MSKPLFLYIAHQAVHVANSEAPLQAPLAFIDKYNAKILDEKRKHYAAMVRETFKKPNIDSLLQWNRISYESIFVSHGRLVLVVIVYVVKVRDWPLWNVLQSQKLLLPSSQENLKLSFF